MPTSVTAKSVSFDADNMWLELSDGRTLGIGAYLGVPIRLEDMRLYVLCCLDRERRPSLGEKEVRLLSGLAESVRVELQSLN